MARIQMGEGIEVQTMRDSECYRAGPERGCGGRAGCRRGLGEGQRLGPPGLGGGPGSRRTPGGELGGVNRPLGDRWAAHWRADGRAVLVLGCGRMVWQTRVRQQAQNSLLATDDGGDGMAVAGVGGGGMGEVVVVVVVVRASSIQTGHAEAGAAGGPGQR